MKKFILIAVLFCVGLIAQAQVPGVAKAFVADTTTNAEVEYLVIASPAALTLNHTLYVYVKPVNVSGTATVTAAIQTSPDNTNWFDYGSATTVNTAGTVGAYSWVLSDTPFKYMRVKLTSSGTGVTNFTGGIILKRK